MSKKKKYKKMNIIIYINEKQNSDHCAYFFFF